MAIVVNSKAKAELHNAANGLACIATRSRLQYWRLCLILVFRYGFLRRGRYVLPVTDDAIFPDYVRSGLRILAGWDNWLSFHLLAANEQSDAFLRRFYLKHCGGGA